MKQLIVNNEPATELAVSHMEALIHVHSRFQQGLISQDEYNLQMQSGLLAGLDLARLIDAHYGPDAEEVELHNVCDEG